MIWTSLYQAIVITLNKSISKQTKKFDKRPKDIYQ